MNRGILAAGLAATAFALPGSAALAAPCPGASVCPYSESRVFGQPGPADLRGPTDVLVDRDGHLVVADKGNDRVVVLRSDGSVVRSFPSAGFVRALAEGRDGVLYVANGFKVQRFHPDGTPLGEPIGPSLADADGVALGPGDLVYSADTRVGKIHVHRADGTFVRTLGGDGTFAYPQSLTSDAAGRLIVADRGRLRTYTHDGSLQQEWFVAADGVRTGDDGRIYSVGHLGSSESMGLSVFDGNGTRLATVPLPGVRQPRGLDTHAGVVWVADELGHAVSGHDLVTGERKTKLGGLTDTTFDRPESVALAADGVLWVADSPTGRIVRIRADGSSAGAPVAIGYHYPRLAALAGGGFAALAGDDLHLYDADGAKIARSPASALWGGIAGAPDGTLWATDASRKELVHLSATGAVLGRTASTALSAPDRIAVAPDGSIWVRDGERGIRVTPDGRPLAVVEFGFAAPEAIAVDERGRLFAVTSSTVQIFTPEGRFITQFGGFGTAPGRGRYVESVAVSGGRVFLADRANHRVQRFDLLDPLPENPRGSFLPTPPPMANPFPPPPSPAADAPPVARTADAPVAAGRDGRARLVLDCAGRPGATCSGTLEVRRRTKGRASRGATLMARGSFRVRLGAARPVRVRLTAAARRLLRRQRAVAAVVSVRTKGVPTVTTRRATVRRSSRR